MTYQQLIMTVRDKLYLITLIVDQDRDYSRHDPEVFLDGVESNHNCSVQVY